MDIVEKVSRAVGMHLLSTTLIVAKALIRNECVTFVEGDRSAVLCGEAALREHFKQIYRCANGDVPDDEVEEAYRLFRELYLRSAE